jgi:PAS domain S-box/diguanylate cyclase (GGDEF) domain
MQPRQGDLAAWWRGLSAPRLVLLAASSGFVVMTLGSASLGALLTHEQGRGDVDTLSWAWRDILAMGAISALVLLAILPLVLRRLSHEKAANEVAQRALMQTKAFNEAVLESMDAGLITLDADTQVLSMNRVARHVHGIDEHADIDQVRELVVASLYDPSTGSPVPREQLPIFRALKGVSCETSLLIKRVNGAALLHVVVRARPIRDDAGQVIAAVAVVHDVTEQVEREQALAKHAADIATLGSATRAVLREDDARLAVCEAALSVSSAAFVSLFEADGHGGLECTASAGLDLRGMRMSLSGRSQVAASFNAARTNYVSDVAGDAGLDRDTIYWLESLFGERIEAAVYTPVVAAGRSIAVLITTFALGHANAIDLVPMLELLAAEAGVAIEREDLLRRLHAQAITDPLTGLGNRRAWLDGLARETARSARTGDPLGVAMLDLDDFKGYNDANGHPAGDALLSLVAAEWKVRLRGGDMICRVGGEEFGLLLPGCPATAMYELVESLRDLVPAGQTVSAGSTLWESSEEIAATVARADALLYEAKYTGRNRQIFREVLDGATETGLDTAAGAEPDDVASVGLHIVRQRQER